MKKLLMSTVLAASSVFAVTACTSVGAATDTSSSYNNVQKQHKGDMKGGMKGPLSQLDLTATQQAQIQAIMKAKHGDRKADKENNKAERMQMQQQMQALMASKTLNTTAVNRLADQQAAKQKQRFVERVQTQHAIAQVLTAEQRAKLAQLESQRKDEGRPDSEDRKPHGKRPQQGM